MADEQNGKPLDAHDGPYRIIVPDEKRQARWVRMFNTVCINESNQEPRRR